MTQRPRVQGSIDAVQDRAPAITWVGHSTVLLELDGVRLLTDPVLRRRMMHLRRVSGGADVGALHDVDALLVSHLHYDHLDVQSLRTVGRASPRKPANSAGCNDASLSDVPRASATRGAPFRRTR